jgi:hypothetical protein
MNLSPNECALIIAANVKSQERDRRKKITRFQLSLLSIAKISKRQVVSSIYLENLGAELLELGWCMFQVENTRFAFIRANSVNSWVKFSSKEMDSDIEMLIELKEKSLSNNVLHNRLSKLRGDIYEDDND